ncbi:MAG: hypothetical protein AAGA75_21765 [Cyanobacteria bacterium P01_E01_bin.6]
MNVESLLLAIAPSPNDKVQIQMIYRTITPDQKGALERTITKLLPVHESHLSQTP